MSRLAENIRQLLRTYQPSADEREFHEVMLAHALDDDCCQRDRPLAHFTASAWVLSPCGEKVLLIFHNKLQRWLQPGGHFEENDLDAEHASRREVEEECGLRDLVLAQSGVFDIDVHVIPARKEVPEHLHLDLRFLFRAPSEKTTMDLNEVSGLNWMPLSQASDVLSEPSLQRMVRKTRAHDRHS